MNIMLTALLLTLAWVPWGEAGAKVCVGEGADKQCWQAGKPPPSKEDLEGALRVRLEDPCLAKMREAMEAMEPFIAQTFVKDQDGLSLRQVMSDTKVRGFLKAADQWELAKRDCWRDTK